MTDNRIKDMIISKVCGHYNVNWSEVESFTIDNRQVVQSVRTARSAIIYLLSVYVSDECCLSLFDIQITSLAYHRKQYLKHEKELKEVRQSIYEKITQAA